MATYPSGVHTSGPAQYPYDDGTMVPFGPDGLKRLADRVALMAGAGIAYAANTAARDALVTNGDAFPGLHCYTYDTDVIWRYFASGVWLPATPGYFALHSTTSGSVASGTALPMTATSPAASHPAVVAASTSALTAAVPGTYRVTAQTNWGTNGTGKRQISVYKNNAAINPAIGASTTVPSDGTCQQTASGLLQLAANDYVALVPVQTSGATVTFSAQLTLEFVSA